MPFWKIPCRFTPVLLLCACGWAGGVTVIEKNCRTPKACEIAFMFGRAEVKQRAFDNLSAMGDAGLEAFAHALSSDDKITVDRAGNMLLKRPGPAVSVLLRAIDESAGRIHNLAPEIVGSVRPVKKSTLARLDAFLSDGRPAVRYCGATALGRAGFAAVSALPKLLDMAATDPDADARGAAISALAAIPPDGAALELYTKSLLAVQSAELKRVLAEAIGTAGPAAKNAVPGLIILLSDPDEEVRKNAAVALGQIGPAAAAAVEPLAELFADTDNVAVNAARALGGIGAPAMPAINAALAGADARARGWAGSALRFAARADMVPALELLLTSTDSVVRADAAAGLARIGPQARAAISALIPLLDDADPQVALAACNALARVGPDSGAVAEAFIFRLNYPLLRTQAALVAIGAPAVPALADALKNGPENRRAQIIAVLSAIGWRANGALAALDGIAKNSLDAEIKKQAAAAAARIRAGY